MATWSDEHAGAWWGLGCALVIAIVVAPASAAVAHAAGLPGETAGPVTGIAAGAMLGSLGSGRGLPAIAAMATLFGSLPVTLTIYSEADGPWRVDWSPFWAGTLPMSPFWAGGAVLAFGIAALRQGRWPRRFRPRLRVDGVDAVKGAGIAGAIAGVQAAVAEGLGVMGWTIRGGWAEQYVVWDHALTRASWYPMVAVIIAVLLVRHRNPETSPRWLPLGAGTGAAVIGGAVLYGQAVAAPTGIHTRPEAALWAAGIGAAIGAAAAGAAMRHRGARAGLLASIAWISFVEFVPGMNTHMAAAQVDFWNGRQEDALTAGPIGPLVVSTLVAAWVVHRGERVGAGFVAGVAGPFLLFMAYLTVHPSLSDQESIQADAWLNVHLGVLLATCVSLPAAGLAATRRQVRGERSSTPSSHPS